MDIYILNSHYRYNTVSSAFASLEKAEQVAKDLIMTELRKHGFHNQDCPQYNLFLQLVEKFAKNNVQAAILDWNYIAVELEDCEINVLSPLISIVETKLIA